MIDRCRLPFPPLAFSIALEATKRQVEHLPFKQPSLYSRRLVALGKVSGPIRRKCAPPPYGWSCNRPVHPFRGWAGRRLS